MEVVASLYGKGFPGRQEILREVWVSFLLCESPQAIPRWNHLAAVCAILWLASWKHGPALVSGPCNILSGWEHDVGSCVYTSSTDVWHVQQTLTLAGPYPVAPLSTAVSEQFWLRLPWKRISVRSRGAKGRQSFFWRGFVVVLKALPGWCAELGYVNLQSWVCVKYWDQYQDQSVTMPLLLNPLPKIRPLTAVEILQ